MRLNVQSVVIAIQQNQAMKKMESLAGQTGMICRRIGTALSAIWEKGSFTRRKNAKNVRELSFLEIIIVF
jgi:hypothetical protein